MTQCPLCKQLMYRVDGYDNYYHCPRCPIGHWSSLWTPTTNITLMRGDIYPAKAGLFMYHGLGSGNYYSTSGIVFDTNSSTARQIAVSENVEYEYYDCFEGYRPVHVGD